MSRVDVRFDERLELLTVLFYMTPYKEFLPFIVNLQEEEEFSLYKKIVATFENIDISAMTEPFEKLLVTENFGFDAPIELFLCIQPDFSSYSLKEELYENRLRKNPCVLELLEAALAFGQGNEWKQFYRSNEMFYKKIIDGLESLDLKNTFQLMEQLYGNQLLEDKKYEVLLMSGTGAGNYGLHVSDTIYCVSGLSDGTWYLNKRPSLVLHEFSHPIINPLTDKYLLKEDAENELIFASVEEKMKQQGYSNDPEIVIDEYMVRTAECCYYKYYLMAEYQMFLQNQKERGFEYIEFLVERYLEFLEQKDRDFTSFYKSVLEQFMDYVKVATFQ